MQPRIWTNRSSLMSKRLNIIERNTLRRTSITVKGHGLLARKRQQEIVSTKIGNGSLGTTHSQLQNAYGNDLTKKASIHNGSAAIDKTCRTKIVPVVTRALQNEARGSKKTISKAARIDKDNSDRVVCRLRESNAFQQHSEILENGAASPNVRVKGLFQTNLQTAKCTIVTYEKDN